MGGGGEGGKDIYHSASHFCLHTSYPHHRSHKNAPHLYYLKNPPQLTFLFDDVGIPKSYRFMPGFGVHTFRLLNKAGKETLVKFHWVPKQGEGMASARAQ